MSASSGQPVSFVVGFGEEAFLVDRVLERGRSWKGRNVIVLDGDRIDAEELVGECETRSFDSTDRVIVLDNAHKVKGKVLDTYIEDKDPQDDSVVIVAGVRGKSLPKVWAKAANKGKLIECPKFKPWEQHKTCARITQEAKRLKLTLDDGIAELFLKVLGDNLRQTVNELKKLVYLVGERGTVKKEHVALVLTHVFPAAPYEVAEAAAAKRPKKAMKLVAFLFKHMGEGASVPVTISLMRLVEKLIIARQLLDKGEEAPVIATRFNMHEYAFQKNLLPLVRKHTVPQLRDTMVALCELEAQVKGPARSKRTLVEQAILSLAA